MDIQILHLVDGTEVIGDVVPQGRNDVIVANARAIVFSHRITEEQQELLSWQIGYMHALQRLNPFHQNLPLRSEHILYSYTADMMPPQIIEDYNKAVKAHQDEAQATIAARQAQVQPEPNVPVQPVDDGDAETQA